MSRERTDRTASGICYSYGILRVLLKVPIKFKNANLNVIVEHFPQTVPVQPYFRETGCVIGCVTAEIKTACSNGSCSILLTETESAMEAGKISV